VEKTISVEEEGTDGKIYRFVVAAICIAFSAGAFLFGLREGFYEFKLLVLCSISLLIFSRVNYPFLFGLLIPTYFELKAPSSTAYDKDYFLQYADVMIVVMAAFLFFFNLISRKNITRFRAPVAMANLALLVFVGIAGIGVAQNNYLFVRRMIEVIAFACAFYIGCHYYRHFPKNALMLMAGLSLGIVTFVLPWTLGVVLHGGLAALRNLDRLRGGGIGAASVAKEAGIMIVLFGLAVGVSSALLPSGTRKLALWGVALPAAIANMLYLSRAAILMMPVVVAASLLISGKRRFALSVGIVMVLGAGLVYVYLPEWVASFEERMGRFDNAKLGRLHIYSEAIEVAVENPLLGIGAGQFFVQTKIWHAHNDILTIMAEHGIVGALVYVFFLLHVGYATIALYRKGGSCRSIAGIFSLVVLCYVSYSQVEPLFFNRAGLLFVYLGGIVISTHEESNSSKHPGRQRPPCLTENDDTDQATI
jgi:O-antigen ligase